jgi:ATP-dependent RNA helicase DDX6/DHH1
MDNPMNVLSQDMARQFIAGSTPEDKYKFFVKGVQLQQLDQDYTIIGDYTDQMKEKLPRLQEEKDALLEISEKAKRRREKADRQQGLQDKIKSLRAQVAWAQVEEQERVGVPYIS